MGMIAKRMFDPDGVVLALDLDYTLAHYRDGMKGLFEVLRKLNISDQDARKALSFAERKNFSFGELYRILDVIAQLKIKESLFMERMQAWFRENYGLYDDARAFLLEYIGRVPIVIVTAGDYKFQREKITHLGFVPDEMIVVSMGDPKLSALKDVFQCYQKTVIFVDDNPNEFGHTSFDAWFGSVGYSVRMRRCDSPHENTEKDQSNLMISSFDQLRNLVPIEKEIAWKVLYQKAW